MKTLFRYLTGTSNLLGAFALLTVSTTLLVAQPVSAAFTYQGQLNDGGQRADGRYDLTFALFNASTGTGQVGGTLTNTATVISNGLFTVTLDFGAVFDGAARWLEIGVSPNGAGAFVTLSPRQPITPVPYALYTPAAGAAAIASTASGVGNGAVTSAGIAPGQVVKSMNSLRDDVLLAAGSNLTLTVNSQTLRLDAPTDWHIGGNAGTSGNANFLGTTDNQPLELKVNSQRALRLEPNSNGAPNVIGGFAGNQVHAGVYGATIAGGGSSASPHLVSGSGGTIGGGSENQVLGTVATVGGGQANVAAGSGATVGGGAGNTVQTSAAFGTIPGGALNRVAGPYGLASGRRANANHTGAFVWADATDADFASSGANQFLIRASGGVGIGVTNPATALEVAGAVKATTLVVGSSTVVTNLNADLLDGVRATSFWQLGGNSSTIPGPNFLGTTDNQPLEFQVNGLRALRLEPTGDAAFNPDSFPDGAPNLIGGAPNNAVLGGAVGATISGGGATNWHGKPYPNQIAADYATIGGGMGNSIEANGRQSTIGGGLDNQVQGLADRSTIAGGDGNIVSNALATVAGGLWNTAGGQYSTVGGGELNLATDSHAMVGGGWGNIASDQGASVAGGLGNKATGPQATIGGGVHNLAGGTGTFIGGGESNLATNQYAVVGGGRGNAAIGDASFVGGGSSNWTYNTYATIGGGFLNFAGYPYATIGGGYGNAAVNVYSTIGGGSDNRANGAYATVPGGDNNRADGQSSFAAGHRAKTTSWGSFVWGDSSSADIWASGANQFVARATGGFWFITDIDANGVPTCQAYLGHCSPSWSITSDRNQKENFKPVDHRGLLERLVHMPVTEWSMKGEKPGIRHIGPVAQDFHAAFGLGGDDDRRIVSSDEAGVALAGIQALDQKLDELRAENAQLRARLERLEHLLNAQARATVR